MQKILSLVKLSVIPVLFVSAFLFMADPAHAQTTITATVKIDQAALGFRIPNLAEVLTFVIRAFFVIAGLIALFYLLIGALEWVTSGGDEEKTGASQKKITAAVIGVILIVVVLAIIVTLEQIVFRQRVCFGISCAASIPSLIEACGPGTNDTNCDGVAP